MKEKVYKYPYLKILIKNFPFFLEFYADHCPFTKPGQFEFHRETIQKRRELGSVKAALKDMGYLKSLYRTLRAWGIGSRGSKLRPFNNFTDALNDIAPDICELDGLKLDQIEIEIDTVNQKIWNIIENMHIVDNIATLVPCSKTLHHILPDLIVPMDREYTQVFFGWQNPQFQYGQSKCFFEAFKSFECVSRETNPKQYVGSGWNTSLSKVIDNAIVGLILYLKSKIK